MFSVRPRRDLAPRTPRASAVAPAIEALEGRQLLSYSPFGSLPDLSVTAQAGAIAAYGGPITVTLDVQNLGASSTVEPLNLQPGSPSTADAPPSHVGVYLLRTPNSHPGGSLRQARSSRRANAACIRIRCGTFHNNHKRRSDFVEYEERWRDQHRQPVGLFERKILGQYFA